MAVYKYRGRWRAEVFVNGVRVAGMTKKNWRRPEAQAWHDATATLFRTGGAETNRKVSFEDALKAFRDRHLPTVSRRTAARYESDIKTHIEPFFRHYPIKKLDTALFDKFKVHLGKRLAPKSANGCLAVLQLILKKAVRAKLIDKSPYDCEMFEVPKREYEWWHDLETVQRFLQVAKRFRYGLIYWLALETGMRLAELIGLWKEDIDFARGTITVKRQWKQAEECYDLPKHQKFRVVTFDPAGPLAVALRAQLPRSGKLMFPTATGGHVTRDKIAAKYFHRICDLAGIPRTKFHSLRHTFASWYMIQHDDVWALKELLGHTDIRTTMRYAHHGKSRRHAPLSLVTHKSRTNDVEESITGRNHRPKDWWGYTDSNSKMASKLTPRLMAV